MTHDDQTQHAAAGDSAPDAADEEIVVGELFETSPEEGSVGGDSVLEPAVDLGLPADRDAAVAVLQEELVAARQDADGYLGDLQRLAAEFENFRKRMAREQAAHTERAAQRVVEAVLPVLDSFDAGLGIEPQTANEEKLLAGMRSTHEQLLAVLLREGLEIVPTVGQEFDPEIHEAVTAPADAAGPLVVSAELRRGYRLHGRVLRAAMVALDDA